MNFLIRNWKKCLFLLVYCAFLIVFSVIGRRAEILGNYSVRNVFYSLATLLVLMLPGFLIILITNFKSAFVKQDPVTVVKKGTRTSVDSYRKNPPIIKEIPAVTFLLPNRMMYTFDVSQEFFSLIKEGDTGTLAYKEYKQSLIYLWFRRD